MSDPNDVETFRYMLMAANQSQYGDTYYLRFIGELRDFYQKPDGSWGTMLTYGTWDNFEVQSQSHYIRETDEAVPPYTWQCGYFEIDVLHPYRARSITANLVKVEKALARFEKLWGPAESYGAYCVRVCSALKIQKFAFADPDLDGYQFYTLNDGMREINRQASKWLDSFVRK